MKSYEKGLAIKFEHFIKFINIYLISLKTIYEERFIEF